MGGSIEQGWKVWCDLPGCREVIYKPGEPYCFGSEPWFLREHPGWAITPAGIYCPEHAQPAAMATVPTLVSYENGETWRISLAGSSLRHERIEELEEPSRLRVGVGSQVGPVVGLIYAGSQLRKFLVPGSGARIEDEATYRVEGIDERGDAYVRKIT